MHAYIDGTLWLKDITMVSFITFSCWSLYTSLKPVDNKSYFISVSNGCLKMFYKIKCDLLQSVMSLELQSLVLGRLLFMCDKFIFFIHLISLVEVIFGSFLYLKTILKWPNKYFAMAFIRVYMVIYWQPLRK